MSILSNSKTFYINLIIILSIFIFDRLTKLYVIYLDQKLEKITKNIDFSEICITSKAQIYFKENLETSAQTTKAKGTKCTLCWKIIKNACDRAHCPKKT